MFGIIRFILAWFVVLAHIGQTFKYSSAIAVYSFYMLSGYLMTLIMNERYGFNFSGIIKFIINRLLRIYPQYWLLAIIALLFIFIAPPEYARSIHPAIRLPNSFHEILSNIFIIGLYPESIFVMARLVPQAWALHVELVFYLLIAFGLGRSLKITLVWFILSVGYHVLANIYSFPRYSPILAASLAFSIGSLLYHISPYIKKYIQFSVFRLCLVLFLYFGFVVSTGNIGFGESKIPFYLNFILFFICLFMLSNIPRENAFYIKIDNWFGDLSYPVYLTHWIVAVFISYFIDIHSTIELFIYSVPIVFILSYFMAKLVESPIERIRHKLFKA